MTRGLSKKQIREYLLWNKRRKKIPYKHLKFNELTPAFKYKDKTYHADASDNNVMHDDIIYAAIKKNPGWTHAAFDAAERGFMYKNKFYSRNMFYHSETDMPIQSYDLWKPDGATVKFYGK